MSQPWRKPAPRKGRPAGLRLCVFPAIALWLLSTSGCSVFCLTARTLICEPLHFCNPCDKCHSHIAHYAMAVQAWKCIECQEPGAFTADFERGYKDGFTDYLDYGGTAAPPPVPPRDYWRSGYRTPAGQQAVKHWYLGFESGALDAVASGRREYATVLTSVPPPNSPIPTYLDWPTAKNKVADPVDAGPTDAKQSEEIPTPAPRLEPSIPTYRYEEEPAPLSPLIRER